jgi:hypothetical protein
MSKIKFKAVGCKKTLWAVALFYERIAFEFFHIASRSNLLGGYPIKPEALDSDCID